MFRAFLLFALTWQPRTFLPEADLQERTGIGTTEQVDGEHLFILPGEPPAKPGPRGAQSLAMLLGLVRISSNKMSGSVGCQVPGVRAVQGAQETANIPEIPLLNSNQLGMSQPVLPPQHSGFAAAAVLGVQLG